MAPAEIQKSFPIFPEPTLPDAPSKSTLALQGLDQAILDADIIHPSTVLSISEQESPNVGCQYLTRKMRSRLIELGITELFAVQTALLPFLLGDFRSLPHVYLPYNPPRDVCVSAPTGSGKTLAYVLPIVEILSKRILTRLRALIVLPTRDLVAQVKETIEAVAKGRGLKIGTATGQHSFAHEQAQLVAEKHRKLDGGSSKVDILICTPGRLIDHMNGTLNFSLQHLRFLVIDEADRLLAQSFQDWLTQVLAATRTPGPNILDTASNTSSLPHPDAVAPAFLQNLPIPHVSTFISEGKEPSCQKLLFSATLTRDPGKIAALELRNVKYFLVQSNTDQSRDAHVLDVVMERFTVPNTLTEHMIICEARQKPLMLFHLVDVHKITNTLVFTKSAESTTRLVRLYEFFEHSRVASAMAGTYEAIVIRAYSSDLPPNERKSILEQFRAQEIQILVCSDLITRGIDISHVSHVVNYDAPLDMRKYVHRVGRTARAGRTGDAWSLVEEQEARHFKTMLREADHMHKIKRLRVSDKDVAQLTSHYDTALSQLKNFYTRAV